MPNNYKLPFNNIFTWLSTNKAILIFIIFGILIYFNGIFNNFVGDDIPQLVENPFVHSIENIPSFFNNGNFYFREVNKMLGVYFRPTLPALFSIVYNFFGPNIYAFHAFQIVLHLINTIILYLFLKYFLKEAIAFILSIIFLVHPINSETVFYISATQDLLFFLFGITALWILIKRQSFKQLVFVSVLLLFSVLSKETGALFIVMAFIFTLLNIKKQKISSLIFPPIVIILYFYFRIKAIGIFTNPLNSPINHLTFQERILNIPAIFFFYLKTFFFPLKLSYLYQWVHSNISFENFFSPLFIDSVFLIIFGYFILYFYNKFEGKYFKKYLLFFIWFILGIIIHLQLLPLDATVAERWFYFPIVGLLGMFGILFEAFEIKFSSKIGLTFILLLIFLLSVRTFVRSFDWRDELKLSMHDVKVSPDSYALENAISLELTKEKRYQDAKTHAEKSIEIYPSYNGYNNLGLSYLGLGEYQKAKEAYQKALKFGDYPILYENLAGLYLVSKEEGGIDFIKTTLNKFPQNAKLWLYLSILEYNKGNIDEAKNAINQAYKSDQGSGVKTIYFKIMNNQPLQLEFSVGK